MIKKKIAKRSFKRISASLMALTMIMSSGTFNGIASLEKAQAAVNSQETETKEAVVTQETSTEEASGVLSNEERGVIYANSRTDFRDESIYFVITTRFYDGDSSNNARTSEDDNKAHNPESDPSWRGDFAGLIEQLDYIKALGFTAIWITPVVENNSGYDYHGYHAYDFSAVDKRYESNGITYQTLIDACHDKGIKVIQDIVLNHTCNWGERNLLQLTSDIFTQRNSVVMSGGYYTTKEGQKLQDTNNIYHHNGYCGGGDWDEYAAQPKTIHDDCLDLETENPIVYNYLIDCYKKYINMGVDGFRVDTVKHISRLTFNSTFIPAFEAAAKATGNDDFYMFGEVCTKGHDVWYRDCPPISTCFYTWADSTDWTSQWSDNLASNEALVEAHHAAYNNTSIQPTSDNAFLNGNDYHTPDYSQASGLNSIDFQMHWSFNSASQAFATAKGEDAYFNDSTWNVVYVDSHDFGPDESQKLRYQGGTDAWAENLDLMFTFRGIPCVFYGSEIEFQAGQPIDVGPDLPLSQTGRAYYGDHLEGTVDTADFTVFGNLSGEVESTLNSTLSQHIMRLNRIRQTIPALRKGQYSVDGCSGNIAYKRRYTDSTTDSFCLVAISGNATFTGIPNGTYVDAVTGDTKTVTNGTLYASVSGKGNMKVYVLNTSKTPAPGRIITNGTYLTDGGSAELIGPVDINIVEPTAITVDKTSVTVLEEESAIVTATIAPSNASNKIVSWSSSNTSVATVSSGKITGVSVGTATITAKTYNGLTATVKVTVKTNPNIIKATAISVSPKSVTLKKGETQTITATITPSNTTNKTVTWTTSDSSVATVSAGEVTAKGEGTATITATTSNGLKATTTVTVEATPIELFEHGVYFEKPASWNDVYVYMFSDSNKAIAGTWPGTKISEVGDGIYGYEYPASTDSSLMVIFTNNAGAQTADLTYKDNGLYNISGFVKVIEPATTGKVTVSYVDESGNSIATATTLTGNIGEAYTTSAKTISGYTLKTTPSNAKGTYTASTISVKYVYTKNTIVTVPALPTVTLTAGNAQIKATWSAVSGATKYRVFTYDGSFHKIGDTTNTSYTITGLTNGTKYGVIVLAYNGSKWSSYTTSDVKYATPVAADFVTPTVTLKAQNGQIAASWKAVSGATTYRVFTYLNGKYKKIADTTSTSYKITGLTNGTKYGVIVLAYNGSKWTSYTTSDIKYATPTSAGVPSPTVVAGNGKITVSWSAISGGTKYRVFTYDGSFHKIGDTTGTSYTITGLTNGKTYGVVVLVYSNGEWQPYTMADVVYATPKN